jgi:hypothetical protein
VDFVFGVLSLFLGVLSVCQAIARKDQQHALRAYSQGMYNQLWRMGASAEALLGCNDLNEAKRLATGINEVSQAVRNAVIAFRIITALSRIRWLFVIARNSSFTYKRRSVDVKQVGRELGVRYVLEGSVRKGGNRVRITAQLIEAETGAHPLG